MGFKSNLAISTSLFAGLLYVVGVPLARTFHSSFSPRISHHNLNEIVDIEKRALDCKKDIKSGLDSKVIFPVSRKTGDNRYEINLNSATANLGDLRYLVFKICNGYLDNHSSNLHHIFIQEPNATAYEILGLRFSN